MASHELLPQSMYNLELIEAVGTVDESGPRQVEFDINVDGSGVGEATLVLDHEEGCIKIDWIGLAEGKQGKGYGKQVAAGFMKEIARSYEWARSITYDTEYLAALKIMLAASLPDGWERNFVICEWDNQKEDYFPVGTTNDPNLALANVSSGGSVRITIEKPHQS